MDSVGGPPSKNLQRGVCVCLCMRVKEGVIYLCVYNMSGVALTCRFVITLSLLLLQVQHPASKT